VAAIQVVNFFKQTLASGGSYEALAPGSGDPTAFAVVPPGTISWLADLRGVDDAGPAEVSVTAPGFHDQILGIIGWIPDGTKTAPPNRPVTISPPGLDQAIIGGNTPTVNVNGTNGDNVNVTAIIYHSELPGSPQNLMSAQEVQGQKRTILGVDVTVDPGSVAQGDWSSPVSLSAAGRRLDAARRYALVGFTCAVPLAAVGVVGFETSGLKVGGPVLADGDHDASLVFDLAQLYQTAIIPVFSGANQDNVYVYAADPAAGSTKITVQFADLTGPT
jgi:hypothetical protein